MRAITAAVLAYEGSTTSDGAHRIARGALHWPDDERLPLMQQLNADRDGDTISPEQYLCGWISGLHRAYIGPGTARLAATGLIVDEWTAANAWYEQHAGRPLGIALHVQVLRSATTGRTTMLTAARVIGACLTLRPVWPDALIEVAELAA